MKQWIRGQTGGQRRYDSAVNRDETGGETRHDFTVDGGWNRAWLYSGWGGQTRDETGYDFTVDRDQTGHDFTVDKGVKQGMKQGMTLQWIGIKQGVKKGHDFYSG